MNFNYEIHYYLLCTRQKIKFKIKVKFLTDRQTEKQTERQTDRQIGRRETEYCLKTKINNIIHL